MRGMNALWVGAVLWGCGSAAGPEPEPHTQPDDTGLSSPAGDISPSVGVTWPPMGALTDADVVLVRGSAADDASVVGVTVDGVASTSDDGFRTWQAWVPSDVLSSRLRVEARDAAGNIGAIEHPIVVVDRMVVWPRGIAYDASRGLALVSESLTSSVIGVDVETGDRRVLADARVGTGVALEWPDALVMDGRGRALLVDRAQDALVAIDLDTLSRTEVSGPGRGAGPPLHEQHLTVDEAGRRAFVSSTDALQVVDLESGNRATLADEVTGDGPELDGVVGLIFDPAEARLLVGNRWGAQVLSVTVPNGDRALVADDTRGEGPGLSLYGGGMAVDPSSGLLLATAPSELLWLDPTTGDRGVLSGAYRGQGPSFANSGGLALDPAGARAFIPSRNSLKGVISVDLTLGDRAYVSPVPTLGEGPDVYPLFSAFVDGVLYVADTSSLNTLDPQLGTLVQVSGPKMGAGPNLQGIRGLAVEKDRAYVIEHDRLMAIRLDSGDRVVLSDTGSPGPSIADPEGLAVNESGYAYVLDGTHDAILRVDLLTGTRTLASGDGVGSGPELMLPDAIAPDLDRGRLFVADSVLGLVEIDVATGDRRALQPQGGHELRINDLEISPDGRTALVIDHDDDLRWLDLGSMSMTPISDNAIGAAGHGPPFVQPRSLAVDRDAQVAYVGDSFFGWTLTVDLATGERAVIAR